MTLSRLSRVLPALWLHRAELRFTSRKADARNKNTDARNKNAAPTPQWARCTNPPIAVTAFNVASRPKVPIVFHKKIEFVDLIERHRQKAKNKSHEPGSNDGAGALSRL
jgi:hypothetical protein